MTNTTDNYVSNTRGCLTASKLKLALDNLMAYKIVFMDTDDEVAQKFEDVKVDYFNFGTMAHQFLEQYNAGKMTLQEMVDKFLDEYNITNMYQKKEIVEKIVEADRNKNPDRDEIDEKARIKELTKTGVTLDDLRKIWYGADKYADIVKKKKITKSEARDLIIGETGDVRIADSILKVAVMNKDRDMGGTYSCEERIEATYKGKKLGAKPDRMVFWSDNDKDTRITIEEMDDIMKEMNREERKAFAEDQKLRCMIRDYKTAADPRKIWYEIKEYGDTKTGYVFSMAFYYLIVWARYGVKSEVCLDVIKSKSNFLNYTHHIPSEIMVAKMNTITGVIDSIVEAEKTEERGTITIQDIFDGNKLSNYYSLLAPHMSSSRIVEDVYMG